MWDDTEVYMNRKDYKAGFIAKHSGIKKICLE